MGSLFSFMGIIYEEDHRKNSVMIYCKSITLLYYLFILSSFVHCGKWIYILAIELHLKMQVVV